MVQPSSNEIQSKLVSRKIHSRMPNFVEIFRPIYYFARFSGQLPFSIVRNPNGESFQPRVYKRDALWFVITLGIYAAVIIRTGYALTFEIDSNKTEYVLFMGNALLHIMTMTFGILKVIQDMCSRHKFVDMLNEFARFDQEVSSWDSNSGDRKSPILQFPHSLQIMSMGIHFNLKKNFRQACRYCITMIISSLLLNAMAYFIFNSHTTYSQKLHPSITLVSVLGFVRTLAPAAPGIAFIFLLQCLYKRLAALNSFLRWVSIHASILAFCFFQLMDQFFCKIRNRFFNGNSVKLTIDIRKDDSISAVKFLGRQHSQLVGIMEHINFCYSFQVW